MKTRVQSLCVCFVLVLLCPSSARGAPLLWTLQNVTFGACRLGINFPDSCEPGGMVTGYFVFDAATRTFLDWSISVQGGAVDVFPPFAYVPANSTAAVENQMGTEFVNFDGPKSSPYPQNRQFRLAFVAPLTDNGGTIAIDLSNAYVKECYNCEPQRLLASGYVTTVYASHRRPVANAGPDQNAIVGESVQFDGSQSSASDGSIVSFLWDFGDGASGEGATTSHAYTAAGTFTVALTVIDSDGATAADMAVVNVQTLSETAGSLSGLVASYRIPQGIAGSLDAKLRNAQAALTAANAGQRQDAVNKLLAFVNEVEAQRGKDLTNAQADELEAWARRILALL